MEKLERCSGCMGLVNTDLLHVVIPEKNEIWHVECFYEEYEDLCTGGIQ